MAATLVSIVDHCLAQSGRLLAINSVALARSARLKGRCHVGAERGAESQEEWEESIPDSCWIPLKAIFRDCTSSVDFDRASCFASDR